MLWGYQTFSLFYHFLKIHIKTAHESFKYKIVNKSYLA